MFKQLIRKLLFNEMAKRDFTILRGGSPFAIDVIHDLKKLFGSVPVRRVLDVGANIGSTALQFAESFEGADIWAFEPIASTYQKLVSATKACSRIHPFQCALGDIAGEVLVHTHSKSELNSLNVEINNKTSTGEVESVSVKTIDSMVDDTTTIDLLKTDTEGYDINVLRGAERLLRSRLVRTVYAEVGFQSTDRRHTNFFELHRYLEEKGFHLVGIYEQSRYGAMACDGFANALFLNASAFTDCARKSVAMATPRLVVAASAGAA
jgi:FkbM family methyltransferase